MIAQWLLSGVLTAAFTFSAFGKLSSQQMQVDSFAHLRLPQWFRYVTGIIQMFGVILLITGFWDGIFLLAGSLLLGMVMVGAVIFHVRTGDPAAKFAPAVVLSVLNFVLAYVAYLNM